MNVALLVLGLIGMLGTVAMLARKAAVEFDRAVQERQRRRRIREAARTARGDQ